MRKRPILSSQEIVEDATKNRCLPVRKNKVLDLQEAEYLLGLARERFMWTANAKQLSTELTGHMSRADTPEVRAFFERKRADVIKKFSKAPKYWK